jgi:hypothetical protein
MSVSGHFSEKKSSGEIQALASKKGWTVGPLTYRQVQRMDSDQYRFHEIFNKAELEKALDSPRVEAENKKNAEASKAGRMWADQATPEETEAALAEVTAFCSAYPQFIGGHVPNRKALIAWLQEKNLPVTFANLSTSFQALGSEGKILVNPSALGIGTDTEVGGARLKNHPELWRLLEPALSAEQKAKIAEQKMSAKQYREAHKEDWRIDRIPDQQRASWNKAIGFFLQSRPDVVPSSENLKKIGDFIFANGLQMNPQGLEAAYKSLKAKGELELNEGAVQEGQALRYTNLADTGGDVRSGFVGRDTNLAAKIASMSADEYSRWLQSPSNRKAADALVAGR